MKLDFQLRQPRRRPAPAVELLRQDKFEEKRWDPRKELSGVVAEWKELAGLSEEELTKEEKDKVIFSAWYALVDPEYNQLLQANPWVQRYAVDFFNRLFTLDGFEQSPPDYTFGAYTALLPVIQAFPRLRQELRLQPGRENDFELVVQETSSPTEERVALLLQVWPEKKQEILRHFSAFDLEAAKQVLDSEVTDIFDLESVKDIYLLFPEMRKKFPVEKFIGNLHIDLQVADSFGNFGTLYPQLFNLILLSADSFELDDHGQIHIQMERHQLHQSEQLPERSQV